jgi:two-component system, OmpR family, KDP operon response regulator KdpE
MKTTVLIIDDEVQIRRLLKVVLEGAGYGVKESDSGVLGMQAIASTRPDIVLLDMGLPDIPGLEILKRLREWSAVPVVILTVQDHETEKVRALDYVTKPFGSGELLARIRAALRRSKPQEEKAIFSQGGLEVDLIARTVKRDETEVSLTPTEWSLLTLLIRHAGRIVTHHQILREVWGPGAEKHRDYLRVYLTHLRKKVERTPARPELIINEPGVGYRLKMKD